MQLLRELQRTRHYHSQVAPKQRPSSGYRRAGWHGRGDQGEGAPLRPAPRHAQSGSAPPTTAADGGPTLGVRACVDGAEHGAASAAPARPREEAEPEAAGGGTRGTATPGDGTRPRSRLTRVYSGFA